MVRSMTGYGKSSDSSDNHDIQVEIKSVNHRFLDINFRMPSFLNELELRLRDRLKVLLSRGSLTVFVNVTAKPGSENIKKIDAGAAKAYKDSLENLKDELELSGEIDLNLILKFSDVFDQTDERDNESTVTKVTECFERALSNMISYREKEGGNILIDLDSHLKDLESLINQTGDLAAKAAKLQFEKLLERLKNFTNLESFNKDRLEQELVLISDRVDISEEISRLRSHILLFNETLREEKAVGKILNNLSQEMHREASTISAKTNMTEISHLSVSMKEIIEIIREQVQNVE
ncbi:TPA: YicC family protein [Candidatus Delongbacteria bacterium]|nr:MAG: YicC family protein [Candidatus Delongbacteria bacterium GWF2_40_14]HAQ61218.1 YicC family protein [Candidatus Delongbacteria bacterium]